MKKPSVPVEELNANRIRSIVWEGPRFETKRGHYVRGFVGQTHAGSFKAASAQQPEGATAFGRNHIEIYDWSETKHWNLDKAIAEASDIVKSTMEVYGYKSNPPAEQASLQKSAAAKYGGNDALSRELPPPRRSR
jgi:hypothetical protein